MKIKKLLMTILLLCTLSTLSLGGCGGRMVRGESPYVGIQSISLDGQRVELRLRLRNINDVAIQVARIRFTLQLEETELANFDEARNASVIANGLETLRFELDASADALALFESLEGGEVPNLSYAVEGSISTTDEGPLSFSGEGRIYPVPGRPGQFR